MELHEQVALCFTDAIIEWRDDEIKKIRQEDAFSQIFSHMWLEKMDNVLMDIIRRVGDKFEELGFERKEDNNEA